MGVHEGRVRVTEGTIVFLAWFSCAVVAMVIGFVSDPDHGNCHWSDQCPFRTLHWLIVVNLLLSIPAGFAVDHVRFVP